MKNKRVDLRLNSKIAAHRLAISKLEHYDKAQYTSAIHYIVSAIDAFEEPVEAAYVSAYIKEAYEGSRWNDNCISEIELYE